MFALHLPKDIEERLERLSKETGRSKDDYVCEAVTEHLDEMEDLYLAERVLERVRLGEEGTVPLDEIIARYGLED